MHHAPAVSYPVGRCRFRTCLVLASAVASLVVLSCWTAWQGMNTAQAVGWALGLCIVCLQVRMLRRAPQGWLHWQGDHWLWAPHEEPAQATEVQVVLDWQSGLLLRLSSGAWLWLERAQAPLQWLDLRRAVWGHSP